MPSDYDQLIEMGFDTERSKLATKQTGSLQDAIEWLDKHSETPIDELKAEDEASGTTTKALEGEQEAKSLVCNECGKKFKNHALAEFHATKTQHTDFSESTDEIAPLTEEEKKAKLEDLRKKLAEKRAQGSVQDREDRKKNEEIKRKATKESQDMREELQRKERIKDAEKKRREKKEDDLARKKILDQIARDKETRRLKAEADKAAREGKAPPAATAAAAAAPAATSVATTSKPAAAYTETRLRLQTSQGNQMRSFPVETTLFEVAHAVKEELGFEVTSFTTTFPKKTYDSTDFGMTLKEAGFVPSAALIVK